MDKLLAQQKEVDSNRDAFIKLLPQLLSEEENIGKYALMHNGKIECVLNDFHDAVIMGNKLYNDEPFSIQPIVYEPANLGSHSY